MKKPLVFLCAMLLLFGMVCFSNTALASYINFISGGASASAQTEMRRYYDSDIITDIDSASGMGIYQTAVARSQYDYGGPTVEEVGATADYTTDYDDRNVTVSTGAEVWKDFQSPSWLAEDYYTHAYASAGITFSIESELNQTGDAPEAGYSLAWDIYGTGHYAPGQDVLEYEIYLYDHADDVNDYWSVGPSNPLDPFTGFGQPQTLQYGHTYTLSVTTEVSAWESIGLQHYETEFGSLGAFFLMSIDLGTEQIWDPGPTDPVPEPATMILFGTGLLGLAGIGRRKFKK